MADAKGSVDPNISRKLVLNWDAYPCTISSAAFAVNDLGLQQHLLSNPLNFAESTSCDIFYIKRDGRGQWDRLSDGDDLHSAIKDDSIATSILFFTLNVCKEATFGSQLSLDQAACASVLTQLQIRPEFLPLLLGQFVGNHLPPAQFETYDNTGRLQALDFICQQPRWGFRNRKWPISAWMRYDEHTCMTTCTIVSGPDDSRVEAIRIRLTSSFAASSIAGARVSNAKDPFFFQSLVSHECFMQADSGVFDLGQRLYGALDLVDSASEGSYDRDAIKSLTFKLHQISQDADALIQSADIALSLMDSMSSAQDRLLSGSRSIFNQHLRQSVNTSEYLKKSIEARKRWLLGAKSRKETTMSLVYNLVSQKEAETNIAIARDTKRDSSSMKAIAALTMVFLPASAVSSFFGMSFFDGRSGKLTVTPEWWLFIVVSIPLTVVVIVLWRLWEMFGSQMLVE